MQHSRQERETTQQSRRAGEEFHMWKITITSWVFYAAIKAGLAVVEQSHARQFARYSSDFHKNRLWVGELKMLAES